LEDRCRIKKRRTGEGKWKDKRMKTEIGRTDKICNEEERAKV